MNSVSHLHEDQLSAHERGYVQHLKTVTYAQLEAETRDAKKDLAAKVKTMISTVRDQYDALLYYNSAEHGVVITRLDAFPVAMRRSRTRKSSTRSRSGSSSRSSSRSSSSSDSTLRKFRATYEGAVGIRKRAEHRWIAALKRYFILVSFRDRDMARNMYKRELLDISDDIYRALRVWATNRHLTGRANIADRQRDYDDALMREEQKMAALRSWVDAV